MKSQGVKPSKWNLIAMSMGVYAEIEGRTTMGSLDGLTHITGVSRGSAFAGMTITYRRNRLT